MGIEPATDSSIGRYIFQRHQFEKSPIEKNAFSNPACWFVMVPIAQMVSLKNPTQTIWQKSLSPPRLIRIDRIHCDRIRYEFIFYLSVKKVNNQNLSRYRKMFWWIKRVKSTPFWKKSLFCERVLLFAWIFIRNLSVYTQITFKKWSSDLDTMLLRNSYDQAS